MPRRLLAGKDDGTLLFHAGFRATFPELSEAVKRVIAPKEIRWIGWSHFGAVECGALNEWLGTVPNACGKCWRSSARIASSVCLLLTSSRSLHHRIQST